jgi:hypothetical protein
MQIILQRAILVFCNDENDLDMWQGEKIWEWASWKPDEHLSAKVLNLESPMTLWTVRHATFGAVYEFCTRWIPQSAEFYRARWG